jgi:hypothetical protein
MEFDASRLRSGELIAGASAVLLFIVMFLSWYGLKVNTGSLGTFALPNVSYDAWDAFSVIDLILLLTVIVALALVVTQATRRSPAIPVSLSVVTTTLAGLSVLLIVFRLIDPPSIVDVPAVLDAHLDRTLDIGIYLGLVAALGILYGGYRSMRVEGLAPRDARSEIETIKLGGASGPTPPPSVGPPGAGPAA